MAGRRSREQHIHGIVAVAAGAALALAAPAATAQTSPPSAEQMWQIIQAQQREIEQLKAQLDGTDRRVEETGERLEAATEMIEQGTGGVSSAASWAERTSLGGYAEVHYNNLEDDETGEDFDQVDVHRLVLFIGHEFNESTRFFSELEVEHALTVDTADGSGPGAVELEQAWVELDLAERHATRAGLDLLPVGILNPTHEPDTFFGVERNPVESEIIPTTWWEPGIALLGEIAPGWRYHAVLHDGLDVPTTGGSAFRIRSGRQKGAKADASAGAITGQLRYTGVPGLEVAFTGQYQQDVTQGAQDIDGTLFTAHADWRRGPFGLRALFARWDLDEGAPGAGPATGPSPGRDEQYGWYVEPSYRFDAPGSLPGELGMFARYNQLNRNAGDASLDRDDQVQIDVGLNYWPHPNVVFKFDVQEQLGDANDDGFNLGVGTQF